MIKKNRWKWFGTVGHLCVGSDCRFHLTTQVGKYLISTVGDYYPSYDPSITEPKEIGCGRLYETMVFEAGSPCSCGCNIPSISGNELDSTGYNKRGDAQEGHMKMCIKWSKKK